ncbi:MAG TPA: GAF domain-containing sensor histidine kinase [Ktedonobacterales bacterium]|jgi:signal transduction histidine kinase
MDFPRTEAAFALQSAPYVILSLYAIRRFIRQPTASFFYGLLTGITSLGALLLAHIEGQLLDGSALSAAATTSTRLNILCLLCAIFFLFLLARHLTALPRWLQWSLTALFFLTTLLVLAPAALKAPLLLLSIGASPLPFVFWRQSQHCTGATRRQVQWLGVTLALLLLTLPLIALGDVLPPGPALISWALFPCFLLSGIALCLGIAPPRWLSNFWQTGERARIGQLFDTALLSAAQPAQSKRPDQLVPMLEELLQHALRALNCQTGVIERWNENANTFEALAEASVNAPTLPRELLALKNGRLCEAFTRQQSIATPLDTKHRFFRWCHAHGGTLLAAPILANGKALGVVGLACERPPLFPDNHLALLQAFAQQIALWLVSAQPSPESALFEQMTGQQQEKDEFMAVMVHELRSPLTVLKGRLQLLKRQFAKEGQTSALEAVNKLDPQFQRLQGLIDALVDVSYLDAGRFRLNREPLDLAALIDETLAQNRNLCADHALVLELTDAGKQGGTTSDHPQPLWVMGDFSRLTQVLQVLLNQACYATPAGSLITVHLGRSGAGGEAVVRVRDQGAGIPLEKQAWVFQRQARSLTNSTGQGTGLELYISYQTIRHHNGRMWVESSGVPGEGATFSFSLPLLDSQHAPWATDLSQAQDQAVRQNGASQERENADLSSLPLLQEQTSERQEQPRQEVASR